MSGTKRYFRAFIKQTEYYNFVFHKYKDTAFFCIFRRINNVRLLTMANITDLILSQVKSAAGSVEIPSNIKDTVLNGLTGAITGSLTKTAAKSGALPIFLPARKRPHQAP